MENAETLESRAYLAKTAAIGLRLAVRGCSLQGDERQAVLEMAEDVEARIACVHALLYKENAARAAKRGRQ
jgi:hypothetical protein